MKHFLLALTCLLSVRLARVRISHNGDGEYTRWYDHSMYFDLPVSCKFENQVKVGDDLFQTIYWREKLKVKGAGKDWSLTVMGKTFSPDLEELE